MRNAVSGAAVTAVSSALPAIAKNAQPPPAPGGKRLLSINTTADALLEPYEDDMAWAVAAANTIVGPVHAASSRPTPAGEISRARALWRRQASPWDQLTMVPYQGPIKALTHYKRNSPEVQRILRKARQRAKIVVAQAEVLYSSAQIAQRSVAAASLAIAAAAKGENVSVGAAAATLQQVSDISARIAWDGDNAFGFDIGIGGLVDEAVADKGWEVLYDALRLSLPWINLQVSMH